MSPSNLGVNLLLFLGFAAATSDPSSPTAYYSIYSMDAYATMRPCAAGCLSDNNPIYPCGYKGYHDLVIELQCGCGAKNFCYRDTNNTASASSYLSSCVSANCDKFPTEVANAISLYDSYCATVNVAAAVVTTETSKSTSNSAATKSSPSQTTPTAMGQSARITGGKAAQTETNTDPTPTETSAAHSSEKAGLSQSDVIALAVGLGVGVPSLLLALATFCLQKRRRRGREGHSRLK